MRQWTPAPPAPQTADSFGAIGEAMGVMVRCLGERGFAAAALRALQPLVPAASWSVYRIGPRPELFFSASLGMPDATRDCWRAYLSGPHLHDRSWSTLGSGAARAAGLCHVSADEIGGEHKARVYDAHGMAERLSIVEAAHDDTSLFAVNFYRHRHQRPLRDAQIADFGAIASAVLELVRKQIALTRHTAERAQPSVGALPSTGGTLHARLSELHDGLTPREIEVCVRLLQGMTHEGIACDLGLSAATVKTYRNRAFARLGIHFRNELFALALGARAPG